GSVRPTGARRPLLTGDFGEMAHNERDRRCHPPLTHLSHRRSTHDHGSDRSRQDSPHQSAASVRPGGASIRSFPAARSRQRSGILPGCLLTAVDGTFIWTPSHDQTATLYCSLLSFVRGCDPVGPEPRSIRPKLR